MDEIERIALEVRQRMDSVPGLFNVQSSIEGGAPEVEVVIDRIKAGMYNLNVNTVVSQPCTAVGKMQDSWNRVAKCAISPEAAKPGCRNQQHGSPFRKPAFQAH